MINSDKTNESIDNYIVTAELNDIANNPAVSGIVNLIAPVFEGMKKLSILQIYLNLNTKKII